MYCMNTYVVYLCRLILRIVQWEMCCLYPFFLYTKKLKDREGEFAQGHFGTMMHFLVFLQDSGLQFLYTWLLKSQMSPFLGISLSHIYNQVYYPPSEECSLSSYHLLKFRTPLKAHSITKVPCRIIWSPLATVSAQLFLLHKPVLLSEVWLPWALSLRLCFLIVLSKTVTEVVSGRDSSKIWPAFSPLDYTV